eukprot:g11527.t1
MSQFDLDLDPPAALHEQDNILSHMILVWGFSDIEWRFPLDDGVETTDLLTVKRAKEMLREESKKPRSKVLYPDHAAKNTTEKETSFIGHLQEDEEQELHKENEHDFWVAGGATIPVDAMILLDMEHHEHDSDGHDDLTGAGQDDAAGQHEESDHAEPFSVLPDATLMRTVGYRARVCLKPLEAVVQPADAIERLKDKIDKLRKVDGFWVWDRSVLGVAATEWRMAEDIQASVEEQYVDALGKLLFFVRAKHAGTLSQKQFCLAARISFLESWIPRLTELMFSHLLSVPLDGDLARSLVATELGHSRLEDCQDSIVRETRMCCNFGLGRGGLKKMIKSGRVCFPIIRVSAPDTTKAETVAVPATGPAGGS